jgi:hypothetical protein
MEFHREMALREPDLPLSREQGSNRVRTCCRASISPEFDWRGSALPCVKPVDIDASAIVPNLEQQSVVLHFGTFFRLHRETWHISALADFRSRLQPVRDRRKLIQGRPKVVRDLLRQERQLAEDTA